MTDVWLSDSDHRNEGDAVVDFDDEDDGKQHGDEEFPLL